MATIDDIVAMKIDVISKGGRKKDFWDLHELLNDYSLEEMFALLKRKAEFTHDEKQIWRQSFIKEDIEELVEKG